MKYFVAAAAMLLLTLATPEAAQAQRNNAVYFELVGNGGLYSFNYERSVAGRFRARLGVSYFPGFIDAPAAYWFPVMAGYIVDSGKHQFEFGFGPIIRYVAKDQPCCADRGFKEEFYTATIAYRYESAKGVLFRVGLTPLYAFAEGNKDTAGWAPLGGISIGYAF